MTTTTEATSIAALLFRNRQPVAGAEWVRGGEEHEHLARRNATGRAGVSAILARSLVATATGAVREAGSDAGVYFARVASRSRAGAEASCWMTASGGLEICIPHGAPDKVTYHLGILALVEAIAEPDAAADLLDAYRELLEQVNRASGLTSACKPQFCRAADELYYFLRYASDSPTEANDRLAHARIRDAEGQSPPPTARPLPVAALSSAQELGRLRNGEAPPAGQDSKHQAEPCLGSFVGWQGRALEQALLAGDNVLLAGPTGTGKTFALMEVIRLNPRFDLIVVEGKEGLIDMDFLGAILPTPDGKRVWTDGPVLRALRLAQLNLVVLFLDEINRVPRQHINLLLGLMNPKPGDLCRAMGLPISGSGPFYVLEVPMTSEVVWCPAPHLRIVGAGNFGRAYAVYELDPAVRRRFDTVIEFGYLPAEREVALVLQRSSLERRAAEALVAVAVETRRLHSNGELPGCIDTASLLNWAGKCSRLPHLSVQQVMGTGGLAWGDLVCGREHTGQVNQANFHALMDYLLSLGILPEGSQESPSGGGR